MKNKTRKISVSMFVYILNAFIRLNVNFSISFSVVVVVATAAAAVVCECNSLSQVIHILISPCYADLAVLPCVLTYVLRDMHSVAYNI